MERRVEGTTFLKMTIPLCVGELTKKKENNISRIPVCQNLVKQLPFCFPKWAWELPFNTDTSISVCVRKK